MTSSVRLDFMLARSSILSIGWRKIRYNTSRNLNQDAFLVEGRTYLAFLSMDQQVLFFISALGVFNGFLMAIYYIAFVRGRQLPHVLFGLMLLALSLRIGKSVLLFFIPDLSKHVLQLGLSAIIFVGPLLLFYSRSVLQKRNSLLPNERWQLIGLASLVVLVGALFPYASRPDLWNPLIVLCIYAVWAFYIVWSGIEVLRSDNRWLKIVFLANALICLIFHSIAYFSFPSYILGSIVFSCVFYLLLGYLIFSARRSDVVLGNKRVSARPKLDGAASEVLGAKLASVITNDKVYLNPELKVETLATILEVKPHVLSQYLNANLSRSFRQFINEHRVKAAAEMLTNQPDLSFEGIGREVGFKSKSAFYAAFKKQFETTPTEYLKKVQKTF